MSKLVVFLGNPGSQYEKTRHNTGWLCCSYSVKEANWQEKFHGMFIKKGNAVFLKPLTYMNESGISVQEASKFFGIDVKDILIVHDDIEMKFGEIKLQQGGGMGGHNGLRSVKQHLNSDNFHRLRIGIGRPDVMDVASWVTARFSQEEETKLPLVFSRACGIINNYLES